MDPFKTLGLQWGFCTEEDVIEAFRRLALENHPDKVGPRGAEKMTAINEARDRIVEENLCARSPPPERPQQSQSRRAPSQRDSEHGREERPAGGRSYQPRRAHSRRAGETANDQEPPTRPRATEPRNERSHRARDTEEHASRPRRPPGQRPRVHFEDEDVPARPRATEPRAERSHRARDPYDSDEMPARSGNTRPRHEPNQRARDPYAHQEIPSRSRQPESRRESDYRPYDGYGREEPSTRPRHHERQRQPSYPPPQAYDSDEMPARSRHHEQQRQPAYAVPYAYDSDEAPARPQPHQVRGGRNDSAYDPYHIDEMIRETRRQPPPPPPQRQPSHRARDREERPTGARVGELPTPDLERNFWRGVPYLLGKVMACLDATQPVHGRSQGSPYQKILNMNGAILEDLITASGPADRKRICILLGMLIFEVKELRKYNAKSDREEDSIEMEWDLIHTMSKVRWCDNRGDDTYDMDDWVEASLRDMESGWTKAEERR